MTVFYVFLGLFIVLLLWGVAVYNRLITYRNQVKNAWSQIDVQLQRRYDLIPNLVEAVKGYMGHEKGTLESVIKARNEASAARSTIEKEGAPSEGSIKNLLAAEASLSKGLGNIFALAENYPQLRASENMQQLQEELRSTENKVAFSRQAYNDQVLHYNTAQQVFPANILAEAFGHYQADLFQVEESNVKKAPKVKF